MRDDLLPWALPLFKVEHCSWLKQAVRQTTDFTCGFAVVSTVLTHYNIRFKAETVFQQLNTTIDGISWSRMVKVLRKYGICVAIRNKLTAQDVKTSVESEKLIIAYRWQEDHWVLVCGVSGSSVLVVDPCEMEYLAPWDGTVLDQWGLICCVRGGN